MRALETKFPAPIIAAAAGGAMKFYASTSGVVIDPTPLRMYVGLGLAQASAVLVAVAIATFWHARTTINPMNPGRAANLVTGGVFRMSRNPMYLSLLLLLVAYAVRLDSAWVWCGPLAFVAYVTRFQIHPEERALTAKFGDAYRKYLLRTRRWL